jgi:hypothetical protein
MSSVPHIPPLAVRQDIQREFFEGVVTKWSDRTSGRGRSGDPNTGERRVRDAIEVIDGALAKLGARKGARADAARAYLTAQRDRLAAALAVWESIGEDCDGAAFVSVAERVVLAVENCAAAEHAVTSCDELEHLRALHDARDAARVERNAALKAKAVLLAAARLPALPNLQNFTRAREQSEQIALAARVKAEPMRALHLALEQGAHAAPDVARLWVCFEQGAAELFEARAARYQEEHADRAERAAAAE